MAKARTIEDLNPTSRGMIEINLRTAMIKAFGDRAFYSLTKVKRTDDIATLDGFDQDVLERIFFNDGELNLNTSHVGYFAFNTAAMAKVFGRRIKDWVTLLHWKREPSGFYELSPGLSFFADSRSYVLDGVVGIGKAISWKIRKSGSHDVTVLPDYIPKPFEVSFAEVKEEDRYRHLFSEIAR